MSMFKTRFEATFKAAGHHFQLVQSIKSTSAHCDEVRMAEVLDHDQSGWTVFEALTADGTTIELAFKEVTFSFLIAGAFSTSPKAHAVVSINGNREFQGKFAWDIVEPTKK